jgi:hypothetical protein
MGFVIVGLVLAVIWAAGRSGGAALQALPPPDPVTYSPGNPVLSPAMSGGSPVMSRANLLRLTMSAPNPVPLPSAYDGSTLGASHAQLVGLSLSDPRSGIAAPMSLPTAAPLPKVGTAPQPTGTNYLHFSKL